jgi:transposase-like protein
MMPIFYLCEKGNMENVRKEYSQEDKLAHIAQWLASGKLPSQYSKEMGIAYTTLRNWINKYHRKKERNQLATQKLKDSTSAFLAIQIQPSATLSESNKPIMALVFNSGARLNIYQTVSVEYLQQLLALR